MFSIVSNPVSESDIYLETITRTGPDPGPAHSGSSFDAPTHGGHATRTALDADPDPRDTADS
jgi:hypothetical protein